jgi:hypothetical protein
MAGAIPVAMLLLCLLNRSMYKLYCKGCGDIENLLISTLLCDLDNLPIQDCPRAPMH